MDKNGNMTIKRDEDTNINKKDFEEIISMIDQAREKSYRAVNKELVTMYWDIGRYINGKVLTEKWGKSTIKDFSRFLRGKRPDIKGFSSSNIWRMRQLYLAYHNNQKLAALPREISWTNNVLILAKAKTDESREFYLRLSISNNYSSRELERQMNSMLYERTIISDEKNKEFKAKNTGLNSLRDSYILEFLDIPEQYKEKDLRKAIVANLRNFILEFGDNFTFIGEEYRIQVGNSDFCIDLLLYNRELTCLVAIELKIDKFKPEHLGQLEFYLEALDRNVKKENENPSVGLILCTEKDEEVVEYALNRSMSPALIAEYQTYLPDKDLLSDKLREIREYLEMQVI